MNNDEDVSNFADEILEQMMMTGGEYRPASRSSSHRPTMVDDDGNNNMANNGSVSGNGNIISLPTTGSVKYLNAIQSLRISDLDDDYDYNDKNNVDDDDDGEDESSSIEEDLATVEKMNVAHDFSAWKSFRKSLPAARQRRLRQSLAMSKALSFGPTSSSFDEDDDEDGNGGSDEAEGGGSSSFVRWPSAQSFLEEVEEGVIGDAEYVEGPEMYQSSVRLKNDNNGSLHTTEDDIDADTDDDASCKLTDEERFDNAAWRTRLEVDEVFGKKYVPKEWERKEMDAIIDFLGLRNPECHPEYLNKPQQQITKNAISFIFFQQRQANDQQHHHKYGTDFIPQQHHHHQQQHKSVLLKRGPVLVGGEERELMLFTNGFLLSRVELGTHLDLLLDTASGEMTGLGKFSSEQLCERFRDIDTDGSGALDRNEIHRFFHGMGMSLNETTLDGLMARYSGSGSMDGTMAFDDFKSMMHDLQEDGHISQQQCIVSDSGSIGGRGRIDSICTDGSGSGGRTSHNGSFWMGLRGKLRKALTKTGIVRNLDVAYRMSDIATIEDINSNSRRETRMLVDPELAPLTFAIYPKEEEHATTNNHYDNHNNEEPLVVMCSKPGHVEAWVEAFRMCSAWHCPSIDWGAGDIQRTGVGLDDDGAMPSDWRCSTIDWGVDDDDDERLSIVKKERGTPVLNSLLSRVDWG